MMLKTSLKIGLAAAILTTLSWAGFYLLKSGREIKTSEGNGEKIELERMNLPRSDLSGIRCEQAQARPVAVMLASDPETRPLSGIGGADLVFEMPVTDNGVTRLMAVFQCNQPEEIGSIRSARLDFIPLVQGLGAVYAHWGGEKEALALLGRRIADNLDAMKYEGTVYYRKATARPPHNGFTSFERLNDEMVRLGYNLKQSVTTYLHKENEDKGEISPPVIYKEDFSIEWKYDVGTNSYRRWRAKRPETDRNNSQRVEAANVVIMQTTWAPVSRDYIRVKTIGTGKAAVYKNGQVIEGSWAKTGDKDPLRFYDQMNQEIEFTPGSLWVEIVI